MTPLDQLRDALEGAAADLRGDAAPPKSRPSLERPPKPDFGDYSSNAAMLLAPVLGEKPRDVAAKLGEAVSDRLADKLVKVDIAGPGFLNLFLSDAWYADALAAVLAAGDGYGGGGVERPERTNVEFVSANPTGPLHLGHARNAAYGDAICRLLAFHGHDVHREYYVNDAGVQIGNFAASIQARARGEEPEQYSGDYVKDLAAQIDGAADMELGELGRRGVELMLADIGATLDRFGVEPMQTWFSEASLYEGSPSEVEQALESLGEHKYEADGALWLRTSELGDDKDRVLVKSDGSHTYMASDTAYHFDKRRRAFEKLVDVWGADHHGYVQRTKAAYACLGGDASELDLLIMQFVNLVRDGEPVRMTKRGGQFVTLEDLIDEIGVDAARWYLLARSHDTTIEVDLGLATSESKDNPVYYVQYAHARLASLLARAEATADPTPGPGSGSLHPAEQAVIKRLVAFPAEVAEAADKRAPHRIATYALDLARDFSKLYDTDGLKIVDSPFRLAITECTKNVIARSLGLLGVSAPESM